MKKSALLFAEKAHRGQVHRDGKPAIFHPIRVASHFDREPNLFAIAVLHDVLEDTEVQPHELKQLFGEDIAQNVCALTRGKEESWNHYIRKVSLYPDAVRVKIKDIEDNMRRADQKFQAKMRMYEETLTLLKSL